MRLPPRWHGLTGSRKSGREKVQGHIVPSQLKRYAGNQYPRVYLGLWINQMSENNTLSGWTSFSGHHRCRNQSMPAKLRALQSQVHPKVGAGGKVDNSLFVGK